MENALYIIMGNLKSKLKYAGHSSDKGRRWGRLHLVDMNLQWRVH